MHVMIKAAKCLIIVRKGKVEGGGPTEIVYTQNSSEMRPQTASNLVGNKVFMFINKMKASQI